MNVFAASEQPLGYAEVSLLSGASLAQAHQDDKEQFHLFRVRVVTSSGQTTLRKFPSAMHVGLLIDRLDSKTGL